MSSITTFSLTVISIAVTESAETPSHHRVAHPDYSSRMATQHLSLKGAPATPYHPWADHVAGVVSRHGVPHGDLMFDGGVRRPSTSAQPPEKMPASHPLRRLDCPVRCGRAARDVAVDEDADLRQARHARLAHAMALLLLRRTLERGGPTVTRDSRSVTRFVAAGPLERRVTRAPVTVETRPPSGAALSDNAAH